ncbi:hypothetical protein F4777DRAFT_536329 [Nemania sp. FL0916]|nr:hypothetical protein F4777DRAFT_536329 [Nemania sp. FL0916]
MRYLSAVVFSQLVLANAGDIVVNFDPALEGRVYVHHKIEEVVAYTPIKAQFRNGLSRAKDHQLSPAIDARSLLGRQVGLETLMGKRQQYCDPGYGICEQLGGCCPSTDRCCPYGYCLPPGDVCCPNNPCDSGQGCCGSNHCYPLGGDCCSDESSCYPGNQCYKYAGYDQPVCCTDAQCTAHVEENGSTSYATTTTTTRTYTTAYTQYYYWTVTWWYWYYYWTYSYDIEASIVTSTRSTTSSTLSVQTTDADAASSYFRTVSETLVLPTPSSATELESLASSTFSAASSTSSAPSENPTGSANSDNEGGPSNGAARGLWSGLDAFTVGFVTFGVGVGLVAALL